MTLDIPANDHGKIYVFDVSANLAALTPTVTDLTSRLGVAALNPDYIDFVTLDDLGDKPLTEYLNQGYSVELDATQADTLGAIPSHALLIMSRAFGENPAQIGEADGLRHVLTLADPQPDLDLSALTSEGAAGTATSGAIPAQTEQAPSRVYLYALIIFFAIFALAAWRIASGNV